MPPSTCPTWMTPEFCEINLSAEIGMYCEERREPAWTFAERSIALPEPARPLSITDLQRSRRA